VGDTEAMLNKENRLGQNCCTLQITNAMKTF
jgi:hypothetical protein